MSAPALNTVKPPFNPLNLAPYQADILDSPKRFTITEASTKSGKTYSHIYWLYREATGRRSVEHGEYWWVAPVHAQAQIAFNRLWRRVSKIPGHNKRQNLGEFIIETPANTTIRFKSAKNPDSLYGEDVYAAVFDEFTRAQPEAWYALRSTLTATRGKCKLIGNYKGKSNWGHQLSLKAKEEDSDYAYFKITAYQAVKAGILDAEEIEQAKRDLPSPVFKALYLAEGDIDEMRLIEDDAIASLTKNDHVKRTGNKYLTVDVAFHGSDRFVVCAWDGFVLVDIQIFPKSDSEDVYEAIKAAQRKHGIPNHRVVYDADGIGSFLKGKRLPGAKAFRNGDPPKKERGKKVKYRNLKSQCTFRLADAINKGEYYFHTPKVLDIWPEVMEELEVVKNRSFGTDNKLEILKKDEEKKIIGRSPDIRDALMMREFFELRTGGTASAILQ